MQDWSREYSKTVEEDLKVASIFISSYQTDLDFNHYHIVLI